MRNLMTCEGCGKSSVEMAMIGISGKKLISLSGRKLCPKCLESEYTTAFRALRSSDIDQLRERFFGAIRENDAHLLASVAVMAISGELDVRDILVKDAPDNVISMSSYLHR